ncbi:uncharacterized protein DUF4255 [Nocardia tenerifensis]|uniref:Uncharacterized protein DUF4255 n=1 Tax=Nocardia tenerifensis TaxID=228006 RepID=A0A318JUQ4_9NOCA|nr:DUF4255 domain-containing protein [Nocardia tenerifensis]PXX60824.1 uncharacterized protein DUF4255 [Nocardia tenerifensis]
MSNGHAIAAVTRTLQTLLVAATPNVTMLPLDKARDGAASDEQLNLFLYNTPMSAAFRNSDPMGLRPGESGSPPLPLMLHYLITAYGADEASAHRVLGLAMSILHDHTLLGRQEIVDANHGEPVSDLDRQPERVRITPLTLSTHDMFELWSGFATSYRVSAAYEVSVVLIDSARTPRSPLPVLRRGAAAVAGGDAVLTAVLAPERAMIATVGASVRMLGSNLAAVSAVEFSHPRLSAPLVAAPEVAGDQERRVRVPADAGAVCGFYQVRALTERVGVPRVASNSVPMGLGPTISVTSPLAVPAGTVSVTLRCQPRIVAGQEVSVLLGSASAAPATVVTAPDAGDFSTVTATFPLVGPGTYTVRLRIDGADSDPVRYTGSPAVPEFDPAVQVVVS